jgi:hypothetical protein
MVSGSAASCINRSKLSSPAIRLSRRRPQSKHRWMRTHRPSPRTVTAIGSIPPEQLVLRSPGTLRSRCLDQRQAGQWLRWDVPGASLDTATPQCEHWKEREYAKTRDLSERRRLPTQAVGSRRTCSPPLVDPGQVPCQQTTLALSASKQYRAGQGPERTPCLAGLIVPVGGTWALDSRTTVEMIPDDPATRSSPATQSPT